MLRDLPQTTRTLQADGKGGCVSFARSALRFITVASSVALALALATSALAGGRPFSTALTGAAERPTAGDPDGSGTALITLNQGRGEVCFWLEVQDIILPTIGAHIHVGDETVAGPVVVPLIAPDATGTSSGCVIGVDRELIKDIRQNPADYYINVHTTDFPAGAVRGQLSK